MGTALSVSSRSLGGRVEIEEEPLKTNLATRSYQIKCDQTHVPYVNSMRDLAHIGFTKRFSNQPVRKVRHELKADAVHIDQRVDQDIGVASIKCLISHA